MFSGFEKIVEERIRQAVEKGDFDNLPGRGKPLRFEEMNIPEDLRLAYKILKNADCLPPEIELRKEIRQTEDLMARAGDTAEKYRILKKLNVLIMKLNSSRPGVVKFEIPQDYETRLVEAIEKPGSRSRNNSGKDAAEQ